MAAACDVSETQEASQVIEVIHCGELLQDGAVHTIQNQAHRTEENPHEDENSEIKSVHVVVSVQPEIEEPQRPRKQQEPRSGRIPSRKRLVPFKFRDYRNPDNLNENSDNDENYSLEDDFRSIKKAHASPQRRRGRPRKIPSSETSSHKDMTNNVNFSNQDISIVIIQQGGDAQNVVLKTADSKMLKEAVESGNQSNSITIHKVTPEEDKITLQSIAPQEEKITLHSIAPPETSQTSIEGQTMGFPTDIKQEQSSEAEVAGDKSGIVYLNKKARYAPNKNNTLVMYSCGVCMKKFSTKGNLKTHLKIHIGEKPFHCNFESCQKTFRSNEALRRHKLSHMGIKPFECTFCHNKFSSNVSLQEHMARHTDTKPHQCHICLRNFRQISCLRRHLITHSSETPFSCTICGRKFSQNMYLRSHMKMHTGERPFKCKVCEKAFAHQSDLNRHKIVHSGEKPFECEVCRTRFSDPSSKRRHEREHVGAKPYVCQLCYESFKRAGQLKAHLSRKHLHQKDDVQVIRTSTGSLQFLFQNTDQSVSQQKLLSMTEDHTSLVKQQKIVKLIKDLNSSIQNIPGNPPPHDYSAVEATSLDESRQEDLSAVESVVGDSLVKNQTIISPDGEQNVDTLSSSAFENVQMAEPAVVTIAEVLENGDIQTIQSDDCVRVDYLQIIEELAPESLEQQVVEVHYQDAEQTVEPGSHSEPVHEHVEQTDEVTDYTDQPVQESADFNQEPSDSSSVDYVNNPDFSSQGYYNWLCSFTELCKVMPMPLDVSLFQKISQVHKHLSDVMATPSGVVADRENFKTLMNISKELNTIINEHLCFVMQNLDGTEQKDV